MEVAGEIIYIYDEEQKRFFKEDVQPVFDGPPDLAVYIEEVFDEVADLFNPFVKTFPRINHSKLNKTVKSPWKLSQIGLLYSKSCPNDDHFFSYEGQTVFSNEPQIFQILSESFRIHNTDIINVYDPLMLDEHQTHISNPKLGLDCSILSKPLEIWKVESEELFMNQIYKCAILR